MQPVNTTYNIHVFGQCEEALAPTSAREKHQSPHGQADSFQPGVFLLWVVLMVPDVGPNKSFGNNKDNRRLWIDAKQQ